MTHLLSKFLGISVLLISLSTFSGCVDLDRYGSNGGYNGGYGNSGYGGYDRPYGGGYDNGYDRRERERLERERRRLEDERRRLEDERNRRPVYSPPAYSPPPPPQRPREQCPSGYSPSERKCSQDERKRGCKDMRLPGGLGCVRR